MANQFGIKIEHRTVSGSDRKYTQEAVLKSWNEAASQGRDEYFFKKGLRPPSIAKFGKNANGYHSTMIPYRDIEGKLVYVLCISGKKHQYKVEDDIEGAFAILGTIKTEGQYYW